MEHRKINKRWIFAVTTAVLFPALAFHASCIAVMGPGAWGSGMEEAYPQWHVPTERVLRYAREFENVPAGDSGETTNRDVPGSADWVGTIRQSYEGPAQTVVLTAEGERWTDRQHLYLVAGSDVRELPQVFGHTVTRPTILRGRVIYERWNPWAISAREKLMRYVASWTDVTERPEVSLYAFDVDSQEWNFAMPGHTLIPSPDGARAVLLRSGAMVAGYYSVHIWTADEADPPAILSLREADESTGPSFDLRWTSDSAAIQIIGGTGGFNRRKREPREFNLLYVVDQGKLYDLEGSS